MALTPVRTQGLAWDADTTSMGIPAISSSLDALASMATDLQAGQLSLRLNVAVLKQVLKTEQETGDMLVKMIQPPPSPDGTGQLVDILA